MDDKDKNLEDILNSFVKVFPEFISVVGKIQHRGDSVDFHTLDDLKLCLENPETKNLSPEEQEILFLSVMFHDIAKKETLIDEEHQVPSAHYAKEIIKKLPVSFCEKERIYNLILNSHWTTQNTSAEDLAAIFRHPNDFKIAQILEKADTQSAGFEYSPDENLINEVQKNIKKIQTNAPVLFADNLPEDKSKFPKTEDGIMLLDFTDKEADLEQFGFPAGIKVKDLNLLCHSSSEELSSLLNICDDSKEICSSTSFLNAQNELETYYNNGCSVVLDSTNSDIALGGVNVGCTGGHRGFEHFKDYIYTRNTTNKNDEYKAERNKRQRKEIADFLKKELKLSDDEYVEFFNLVEKYKNKKEIEDLQLDSGRIINADKINEALNNLHKYMLKNREDAEYINEVVVFQPKIQAIVLNKKSFLNSAIKNTETENAIKTNNIPVFKYTCSLRNINSAFDNSCSTGWK